MKVHPILLPGLLIIFIMTIPVTSSFHVSDKSNISNYLREEGDLSNSNSNSNSILSDSKLGIIQDTTEDTLHPNYIKTSELDLIEVDLRLYAETDFVSTWRTDLTSHGSSAVNQVSLPLESSGTYNFTVDWGDGSSDIITVWGQSETTHTYSAEGQYVITISGMLNGWTFNETGDRLKIVEIHQWGNLGLGNSGYNFASAENLVLSATDAPNLNDTTNLEWAFYNARNLGSTGNLNLWDVSNVINMESMFFFARNFSQPLHSWDVSRVTNMVAMFVGASSFNQSLNSWDVSRVTNMSYMFEDAGSFNQPIGSWNVSQVTDMSYMFSNAGSFNQQIGSWNVSQVTDMSYMFSNADSFDQPLGSWNVFLVANMYGMFEATSLSTINYDDLLIGWSQLRVRFGVTFDAGDSEHSADAQSARDILTDTHYWTIYDKSNPRYEGLKGPINTETPIVDEIFIEIILLLFALVFLIGITRMISRS